MSKSEGERKNAKSRNQNDVIEIHDWYDLDEVRDNLHGEYKLIEDLDKNTEGYEELASRSANLENEFEETLGNYGNVVGEKFDLFHAPLEDIYIAEDTEDKSEVEVEVVDPKKGVIKLKEATEGFLRIEYKSAKKIGLGWDPIGNKYPFCGTLFGNGHEIRDLYIFRPSKSNIGLFGKVVEKAKIVNLHVNVEVKGGSQVGGLAGINQGIITDASVKGDVSGEKKVGGLLGSNVEGEVKNSHAKGGVEGEIRDIGGLVGFNKGTVNKSYSTGDVTGKESSVGGLVGDNLEGIIKNSHAKGNVNGKTSSGGLVGFNAGYLISNCYATGDVKGVWHVGGLVGTNHGAVEKSFSIGDVKGDKNIGGLVGDNWGVVEANWGGIIKKSYAIGDVEGEASVGGLIGLNDDGTVEKSYSRGNVEGVKQVGGLLGANSGTVNNSYAAGEINGKAIVGGLVGDNGGMVESSFRDVNTTCQDGNDGGMAKSTAEMKDIATFTDLRGDGLDEPWDFVGDPNDDEGGENIWDIDEEEEINDGYPFLTSIVDLRGGFKDDN